MRLSNAGLALLRQFEGYRSTMYRDAAGLLTVGYGHRVRAGEFFTNGMDESRAEELLASDVSIAEQAVARHVTVPLTQNQFDALVDFVYNLGEGRLAGSTLLRELNRQNYGLAAQQILKWDRCGTAISTGLHRRREAEFALWNGGSAGDELSAPAIHACCEDDFRMDPDTAAMDSDSAMPPGLPRCAAWPHRSSCHASSEAMRAQWAP